jgi:hypothetical protein
MSLHGFILFNFKGPGLKLNPMLESTNMIISAAAELLFGNLTTIDPVGEEVGPLLDIIAETAMTTKEAIYHMVSMSRIVGARHGLSWLYYWDALSSANNYNIKSQRGIGSQCTTSACRILFVGAADIAQDTVKEYARLIPCEYKFTHTSAGPNRDAWVGQSTGDVENIRYWNNKMTILKYRPSLIIAETVGVSRSAPINYSNLIKGVIIMAPKGCIISISVPHDISLDLVELFASYTYAPSMYPKYVSGNTYNVTSGFRLMGISLGRPKKDIAVMTADAKIGRNTVRANMAKANAAWYNEACQLLASKDWKVAPKEEFTKWAADTLYNKVT